MTVEKQDEKIESKQDEQIESKTKEVEKEIEKTNEKDKELDLRLSKLEETLKTKTDEEKAKYIAQLRDEAAANRIKKEKLTKEQEKLQSKLKEKTKTLSELEKKLAELEKKEKDKELADASEIEKLTFKLSDLEKLLREKEEQLELKNKLTIELTKNQKINERKVFIDRLISENNGSFSSEYERSGFLDQFLSLDSDLEFEKSDEEITLEVDKFLTGKRKNETKENIEGNKAGPIKKVGSKSLEDELKVLLSKPELNSKEQARLAEISMQM